MNALHERFDEWSAAWVNAFNAKYKHNRNPTLAGLWDDDPDVRCGAALKTAELAGFFPHMKKPFLEALRKREKVETDRVVRINLMVAISIIEEGVLEDGE
jgi:hypothetical protein